MARADAGLTISQLAEKAGVSRDTISKAEKGQHNLQAGTLSKVARALGMTASELLAEEERHIPKEPPQFDPERLTEAVAEARTDAETAGNNFTGMEAIFKRMMAANQLDAAKTGIASLEAVLKDRDYSLESIETHAYHAIALGGTTRDNVKMWRGTSWEGEFKQAREHLKSVRKHLFRAAKQKLAEERERLDPGKVVSFENRQLELERQADQEEHAVG